MPIFAFITGYFTKDLDKARKTAVEKCLMPYLIFQGIYVIMANVMIKMGLASFNSDTFNSSILVPSSAFYYLLAVFVWKLIAKDFMRLRYPLLFSIILGLLISVTKLDQFRVGYGAVFSLLPFFILGVKCNEEMIRRIKQTPILLSAVILILGIFPAVFLPYAIHSVRMTYSSVGFGNIEGILYRIIFYLTATVMGLAFIRLVGEKKYIFTQIGYASILVYAGSTFLAPHGYVLIDKIFGISNNRVLNMIAMIIFCVVVVSVCALPIFLKWYNAVMNWINNLLFKHGD